ncbi:hypothetical protein VE03_10170 [Pseudogymnoascus sp. 23342-1-I1]|nr:hypothetical protein VE03_10170 [Pseudogymnoascus sp. 23342-1-I1]
MCQFSRVFYAWCHHFDIHRAPCGIPICFFAGSLQTLISVESACPGCMGNPIQPTPPPSPATTRHSCFFARREALDEQNHAPARRQRLLIDTSGNHTPPQQPKYSLYSPMTAKPELLHIVPIAKLPKNSGDCAICRGPLSDCAFDPDAWETSEFPVYLPCDHRHVFGVSCVLRWLKNNSTCPICRCEFHIDRETGGPWETGEERARRIANRPISETRITNEGQEIIADWSDNSMREDLNAEAQDGEVGGTGDSIEIID